MHGPASKGDADESPSDVAIQFYNVVRWDLDQIQDVLTPRVIESSTDQKLLDTLIEFDEARRELHHAIIAHQQVVTGGVFSNVLMLVEASINVYQAILEHRT